MAPFEHVHNRHISEIVDSVLPELHGVLPLRVPCFGIFSLKSFVKKFLLCDFDVLVIQFFVVFFLKRLGQLDISNIINALDDFIKNLGILANAIDKFLLFCLLDRKQPLRNVLGGMTSWVFVVHHS